VSSLDVPVAAIGLAPDGIDFGGAAPSKVVLLTLFPANSGGHDMLPVLEEKLLKDSDVVEDLASSDEADELLEKIRGL
jgi:mannitol/fructose-specific phosphotransferase system IIA component (Ntr-type)